ncbi:MAG: hypothetical protein EBQ94_08795, partial [Flavobacteriales bacterium]|nr:hypothetical protein [Flavobacteriales bacterium]
LVLTINQSPTISNVVTSDVTCFGLNNGSVVINAPTPFPSSGISPAPSGLSPGTYTFTITDVNGCTATTSAITITQPVALGASTNIPPIITNGGTTTLTISPTGGTPPFEFTVNNNTNTTGSFTLPAGPYTGDVTDFNGCIFPISGTILQPAPLVANAATSTAIPCHNGTGVVTVTATGGTSQYTFTNGTDTNTTGVFTESVGTHTYTITDFYNNTTTTSITLVNPPILTANSVAAVGVLACNGNQTTVTVTGTGGTPFTTGLLYTGAGTFTVGAGIHPYTIVDANGCQATTQVTITEPTAITASTQVQNILCLGNTGSINLTVSGGTPGATGTGYTYVWSPGGATTEDLAAVAAGTYTVTISDNNGCTSTQTATVSNAFSSTPFGINNLTGANVTQLTCTTTSISLQGFGGSNYLWSGSASSIGAPLTVTNPGTYNLSLNDSNGCPKTVSIVITQDITQPVAAITNNSGTTVITCTTPIINVTPVGPNPVWSSPLTGGPSQAISSPGTYTVTTTGTNGCTNTASITITQDITSPVAAITNNTGATTLNCNTTSISLTATGGSWVGGPPNTAYSWSNSLGTNATVNVTTGGTYTVTVIGINGCTDTESITINQVANPTVSAPSVSVCSGSPVTISATASDGGLGTYTWTGTGAPTPGPTNSFTITPPASLFFTVKYTDVNGCTSPTVTVTVTVQQSPILNESGTTTLCSGVNGTITATPSPNLPGTYYWSNTSPPYSPSTLPTITVTPLVTTTYSVFYQGPNLCYSDTVYHTITVTPTPVVTVPSTGVCVGGTATLVATANPSGPSGGYVWSANAGGGTTNSVTVTPAANTTYTVTYTLNGCPGIGTASVTVTEQPTVTIDDIGICLGGTGIITAEPSSTAGVGTYAWTPSWTTGGTTFVPTYSVSPPATSPISVVYTLNNCASLPDTAFITVTNAPTITFNNAVVCSGDSAAITATPTPNSPDGTYLWSEGGQTTQTIYVNPTVNTVYTVTYNLYGCLVPASTTVTVNEKPTVTFDVDIIEGCSPLTVKLINTTSQTTNCTWDLGNGTQINQCGTLSYTFMQAGCYDISLTTDSPNGCSNTTTINDMVCVFPNQLPHLI